MTGQQGQNSKPGVKGFIEGSVSNPIVPRHYGNPSSPIPVPIPEGSTAEATYAKMMKDLALGRASKAKTPWLEASSEGQEDRKVQQPERLPSNQEIYDTLMERDSYWRDPADRSTLFYLLAEGYSDTYNTAYAFAIQRARYNEKEFGVEHDLRAYLPIFFNTFYLRLTLEERILEFKTLDAEGAKCYGIQEQYIDRKKNNNQSVRYYLSQFANLEKYYKKVDKKIGISYDDSSILILGRKYYEALGYRKSASERKAMSLLNAIESRQLG